MRAVYRRYFTLPGKLFPKLVGARSTSPRTCWTTGTRTTNQCSECRRCSVFCPYGIDTAEITMAGAEIMDAVGLGQKYSNEIIGKVHRIGNNLGLPGPALEDTLLGLEEDVRKTPAPTSASPLDVQGAECCSSRRRRFLRRAACRQPDRLRQGVPRRRHQLDAVVARPAEAGNFGLFIGNYDQLRKIALRIREAALELGVKRIVVGECGHAWRVAYSFWNTLDRHRRRRHDPVRHPAAEAARPATASRCTSAS